MIDWLGYALIAVFGWAVLRVLNPLVTQVRARHGLAAAWAVAIAGFAVWLVGLGLIVLAKRALT